MLAGGGGGCAGDGDVCRAWRRGARASAVLMRSAAGGDEERGQA